MLFEMIVVGLGYEFVDVEMLLCGCIICVFIDVQGRESGIDVEDCVKVLNQLMCVFEVENFDFDCFEIFLLGLDCVVKKVEDFEWFVGQDIQVKV